jgi:hypothetical protein
VMSGVARRFISRGRVPALELEQVVRAVMNSEANGGDRVQR